MSEQKEPARKQTRAPRKQAPQAPTPEVQNIAQAIETEEILKAARVFEDVSARFVLPDGALGCVQRERRADQSLGTYQLADVRINARDKTESVARHDIARVQLLADVLAAGGVKIFR